MDSVFSKIDHTMSLAGMQYLYQMLRRPIFDKNMLNKRNEVIYSLLELTNLVNERYKNYHFKETIEKNDIVFDYILRKGPCTTRNAIAILKHLGYLVEIHEKAMVGAERYLIK